MKPADIRILVVDDDPDTLDGTARLLERAGYAVDRAASGEATLQIVQVHRPDLLLLDHHLPGINGTEVCRRIKQDPALADSLVVMVSASHAESDQQAEGLELGADGYIGRPIGNRELLARVQSYARIQRLTRSLHLQTEELKRSNEALHQAHLESLKLRDDAVVARDRLALANQALQSENTARKHVEATLRESESRYRLLAENSGDVIWTMNLDGQFHYVSPAIYQLRGYTVTEVMQQPWEEQIAPGSLPLALATFKSLRGQGRQKITGAPVQVELEQRHKDGTTVWTEIACKLVQHERDDSITILGVTRNIAARKQAELFLIKEKELLEERVQERTAALQEEVNERKRAEVQIREAESKYRLLFEMANDGIFIQTATTIIDCNRKGAELFGFRKEQIVGRSPDTLAPQTQPDGRQSAELVAEITQAALIGVPQVFEWQALGAKGALLDVEVTLSRLELGGQLCLQAIVRDITLRKRNQKLIHDTMSLLDATLESTADGILAVDLEGKILRQNQKFVDLWQIPRSIILSRDDHKALAHVLGQVKDPEGFRARVEALYNDPAQESLDLLEFKDGRICERYSQPLRDGDAIVGRVWSFRDVTERARALEFLDAERNLLEERVGERTAALQAEITERKQAEASLRRNEARFSQWRNDSGGKLAV